MSDEEDSSKSTDEAYSKESTPREAQQVLFFKQVSERLINQNSYKLLTFSATLSKSTLDEKQINIEDLINTLNELGCKVSMEDCKSDEEDQQVVYLIVIEEKTIEVLINKIRSVDQIIKSLNHLMGNKGSIGKPRSFSEPHISDHTRQGLGND